MGRKWSEKFVRKWLKNTPTTKSYNELADAVRRATILECAKEICEGCREGWPIENIEGDHMHVLPEHRRGKWEPTAHGTHTGCESQESRALLPEAQEGGEKP